MAGALVMTVVMSAGALTFPLVLVRLTVKVSLLSTMESVRVVTTKLRSWAPAARSALLVLVAVSVTALLVGSVLMALRVTPVAAVRALAAKVAKSAPSMAVPLAVSRVKVTLPPTPKTTPSRETA